jgi:hypothetical protein
MRLSRLALAGVILLGWAGIHRFSTDPREGRGFS